MAVVAIMNSGSSIGIHASKTVLPFWRQKEPSCAEHIRGRDNGITDSLSKNNLSQEKLLFPQADKVPTVIPEESWRCL